MSSISPHDPLDELIAAALHGDMSKEERAQFESRLQNDPAALAAYQETQAMHDLLEKNHRDAQPDPAFEERMISGVRRKIQNETTQETAWESLLFFWRWTKQHLSFGGRPSIAQLAFAGLVVLIIAGVALRPITSSIKKARESAAPQQEFASADASQAVPHHGPDVTFTDALSKPQDGQPTSHKSTITLISTAGQAKQAQSVRSSSLISQLPMAIVRAGDQRIPAMPMGRASDSLTLTAPSSTAVSVAATSPNFAMGGSTRNASGDALDVASIARNKSGTDLYAAPATADKTTTVTAASPEPSLKLIRNAQLDLEVKSFQAAMDQIAVLTKAAAGYVDSSNSEKGGNGKLQGTVVVKVLPQNLDSFLLKLRDVGQVENQSVSTENVTKAYYDTQARLDNSRRMEAQLQELLKHENSKVSDLLQVERELARVRGDIEQMQGQLKLYDFEVQYATVTIQMKEKDLRQAVAYLLKEQDDFSLFASDVEATFKKARAAADNYKAQILQADLNHNSGSNVSAELVVMVAPNQIEPFLGEVRSLGRLANFTRQTQRVAKDDGDSDQPANETRTEKDDVRVHVTIRSDDESRKQGALTVVTPAVDEALDKAKAAALADGAEILSSSLNKTPQGQATAELSVRVPGKDYQTLLGAFRSLGRTSSFSLQRDDNPGPRANGDDAPVIIALSLTDQETPLQETEMSVLVSDVEGHAQAIKKQAGAAGVQLKDSNFDRQPDGTETAQLRFLLPLSKYPAFLGSIKELGKVESLTVQRQDQPAQASTDGDAPVEIGLKIHNQGDVVPENTGLWATLRETFGEGAGALFGSVKTIGVVVAFLAPWIVTLVLLAWIGRRIYVWKRK